MFFSYFIFISLFMVLLGYIYIYFIKPRLTKWNFNGLEATLTNPPWEKNILGEENIIFEEYFNFILKNQDRGKELQSVIIDQSDITREHFPYTRAILSTVPRLFSARIDPINNGKVVLDHDSENQENTNSYVFIIHSTDPNVQIKDLSGIIFKKGHGYLTKWKKISTVLDVSADLLLLTIETKNKNFSF